MPVNGLGRPEWWIAAIYKDDVEGFDQPTVSLEVITNCERYSRSSGLIESCEITTSKLSDADAEKMAAWRGKDVALHDTGRRSFGYYKLESAENTDDKTLIILRSELATREQAGD